MFPTTKLSIAFGFSEAVEYNSFLIDDTLMHQVFEFYSSNESKVQEIKNCFINAGYSDEQAQAMIPQAILRIVNSENKETVMLKFKDLLGNVIESPILF